MGRFLSVDPLARSFSMLTPYQFASNSPIAGIDLDGQEFVFYQANGNGDKTVISTADYTDFIDVQRGGLEMYNVQPVELVNPYGEIWIDFDKFMSRALDENNKNIAKQNAAREAHRALAFHKAKMSNPLYVMSQLSDVKDYLDAGAEAFQGNYSTAGGIIAISLLPEAFEQLVKKFKSTGNPWDASAAMLRRHVDNGGSLDIGLGTFSKGVPNLPSHAITYTSFKNKGFALSKHEEWMETVKQAIETSISNGGRIKFALDELSIPKQKMGEFKVETGHSGATMLELEYILKVHPTARQHTDFYENGSPLQGRDLENRLKDLGF